MESKMRKIGRISILIALFALFFACGEKGVTGKMKSAGKTENHEKIDPFLEANKIIVRREAEEIELFIKRYQWTMKETGSGLRIEILDVGEGDFFKEGDEVTLNFQLFLLDGEVVYDSKNDGKKVFVVDKSSEITGLHEAVKLLKPGGKANLVIPSHLAYGVAGDGHRIIGQKSVAMKISIEK